MDNPAAQFILGNLRTFNLIGILGMVAALINDRAVRLVVFMTSASLAAMSALGLAGKALPSHNVWRVASVWGLLLVPFTSQVAVRLGERIGQDWTGLSPQTARRSGVCAAVGLFVASFSLATLQVVQWTPKPRDALQVGATLLRLLDADPARKALVETTNEWEFIEAAVVLSKPDRLILDAGWDPSHPTEPHPSPGERISGENAPGGAYRMARIQESETSARYRIDRSR